MGGHGQRWSSQRLIDSVVGPRLRYLSHDTRRDGDWQQLTVRLHDPEADLTADVVYRLTDGVPVLRSLSARGNPAPAGAGPDGQLVPLADQNLERLPLATRHVVKVLGFMLWQDIDPISYGRPYYVGPRGPWADRPYALLVEALARTGQAGVCKVVVRCRERIALLRQRHGELILQMLMWQDELFVTPRRVRELGSCLPCRGGGEDSGTTSR
ncbi:Ku protein [Streptomyces sp. NPDC059262]|uniref:Ku protein n=1 Tax=Streptomyces sp. NPDC059262 TaxID=3346797 RepID=UPI0036B067A3